MKTFLIIAGLIVVLSHGLALAQTPPQVQWVGDVPIMPSLTIESSLGFAFDSPEGRIVTIYVSDTASADAVDIYYQQALHPLGWAYQGELSWQREGEFLRFERITAVGSSLWKITIRPE